MPYTRYVAYLEDGECAQVTADGIELFDLDQTPVTKDFEKLTFDLEAIELGGFDHYMQKEIHEQPQTLRDAMRGRVNLNEGIPRFGGVDDAVLTGAERVKILACGTSWHAGLVGKYLFERIAGVPTEVCYAAEFRYSEPCHRAGNACRLRSASRAKRPDTLAGVKEAKRRGAETLGIVNVVGSSIARECGQGVFLHAGPEIGVASTKAFTSQLAVLSLLSLYTGRLRNAVKPEEGAVFLDAMLKLGDQISGLLDQGRKRSLISPVSTPITRISCTSAGSTNTLSLWKARSSSRRYPTSTPKASRRRELKHGPIALVDKNMPVVVLAGQTGNLEKIVANVHEIAARGGRIIAVGARRVRRFERSGQPPDSHTRDTRSIRAHSGSDSLAATGLPYRGQARLRCRQAAKPREKCNRRVILKDHALPVCRYFPNN